MLPPNTIRAHLPTLLDPAACDDCCLAPGSLQRVRQMQALREQGWSLDEIALRFGVSRERVRQIMRAHGGPAPQDIAEARRRRAEALAEARIDELLARWRAGEQPRVAASELGLQAVACRSTIERFATDADRAARKASIAGARRAQTYSDRDIILALTSVATRVGRVPSAKEYAAHARKLNYPSLPTVLNRMGGWTQALLATGLRAGDDAGPRPHAALDRGGVLDGAAQRRRGVRRDPDRARLRAPRRGPRGPAVVGDAAQPARALERDHGAARRSARAHAGRSARARARARLSRRRVATRSCAIASRT